MGCYAGLVCAYVTQFVKKMSHHLQKLSHRRSLVLDGFKDDYCYESSFPTRLSHFKSDQPPVKGLALLLRIEFNLSNLTPAYCYNCLTLLALLTCVHSVGSGHP